MEKHIRYIVIWHHIQLNKKGELAMKKEFLEPELEVIKFGMEDIITTSGDSEDIIDGGTDEGRDFPPDQP